MRRYRIAIIGYGIAGIAAAIALRRDGHDISHFEASAAPQSGAGLLLQPLALAGLHELGVLPAVLAQGAQVNCSRAFDANGKTLLELHYGLVEPASFALGIRRAELLRLLAAQDSHSTQVLRGHRIVEVDAVNGKLATQSGQEFGEFDLILAADGWNSAVRGALQQAFGARVRRNASSALVCVVPDSAQSAGRQLVQQFRGAQHVSYWPVSSAHVAMAVNLLPNTIPVLDRAGFLAQSAAIQPLVGEWFSRCAEPVEILHFRYTDVRVTRSNYQRVLLLGDAAHAMSPMLGLGASLAIEDALSLAAALRASEQLTEIVPRFARQRSARTAPIQRLSRIATALIHAQSPALQGLREFSFALLQRCPPLSRRFMRRFS